MSDTERLSIPSLQSSTDGLITFINRQPVNSSELLPISRFSSFASSNYGPAKSFNWERFRSATQEEKNAFLTEADLSKEARNQNTRVRSLLHSQSFGEKFNKYFKALHSGQNTSPFVKINDNFQNIRNFPNFLSATPSDVWMKSSSAGLVDYVQRGLSEDVPYVEHLVGQVLIIMNSDNVVQDVSYMSLGAFTLMTLYEKRLFDKYNPYYLPPKFLLGEIAKLDAEGESAFVAVSVSLAWEGKNVGHANSMFIDLKRRVVEYFEPHGSCSWHESCLRAMARIFKGYTIDSPALKCPLQRGPQIRAGDFDVGWCKTFSALYIVYRVLNPNVDPAKIAKYVGRGSAEDVRNRILQVQGFAVQHARQIDKRKNNSVPGFVDRYRDKYGVPEVLAPYDRLARKRRKEVAKSLNRAAIL